MVGEDLADHISDVESSDRIMELFDFEDDLEEVLARRELAVFYAQYLSPEYACKVIDAFTAWSAEEEDPGLAIERGIRAYLLRGHDEARVEEVLKDHLRGCVEDVEAAGVPDGDGGVVAAAMP